ncbi:MAG: hypothetical protein AAF598_00160 [Bacteroidota bacterium]
MKEKAVYIPVSCHFHDELELLALRGTESTIQYRDEKGDPRIITTRIKTWTSRKEGEYLVLENGQEIRLDYLIQVNDLFLSDYCGI